MQSNQTSEMDSVNDLTVGMNSLHVNPPRNNSNQPYQAYNQTQRNYGQASNASNQAITTYPPQFSASSATTNAMQALMNAPGVRRRATDFKYLIEFQTLLASVSNQYQLFGELMGEVNRNIDYIDVDKIKRIIAILKQASNLFSRSESTLQEISNPERRDWA